MQGRRDGLQRSEGRVEPARGSVACRDALSGAERNIRTEGRAFDIYLFERQG
jgi:hypothetical protein